MTDMTDKVTRRKSSRKRKPSYSYGATADEAELADVLGGMGEEGVGEGSDVEVDQEDAFFFREGRNQRIKLY